LQDIHSSRSPVIVNAPRLKKRPRAGAVILVMVEVARIELASEGTRQSGLHA